MLPASSTGQWRACCGRSGRWASRRGRRPTPGLYGLGNRPTSIYEVSHPRKQTYRFNGWAAPKDSPAKRIAAAESFAAVREPPHPLPALYNHTEPRPAGSGARGLLAYVCSVDRVHNRFGDRLPEADPGGVNRVIQSMRQPTYLTGLPARGALAKRCKPSRPAALCAMFTGEGGSAPFGRGSGQSLVAVPGKALPHRGPHFLIAHPRADDILLNLGSRQLEHPHRRSAIQVLDFRHERCESRRLGALVAHSDRDVLLAVHRI